MMTDNNNNEIIKNRIFGSFVTQKKKINKKKSHSIKQKQNARNFKPFTIDVNYTYE